MKMLATALLLIFTHLVIAGCVSNGNGIGYTRTTTLTNGTVVVEEVVVEQPSDPKDGAYLYLTGEDFQAGTGAAQDASRKLREIQEGKTKRFKYMWCGLVVLLGVIAGFLPNYLVSNKDAAIGILAGLAGFAVVKWVDSSSGLMGILLPIVAVGGGGYLAWTYFKGKLKFNE